MLTGLLITLDIIVCILLTVIVLMQRSEGGAFGMGGGPTGLITARGAGDLLTRTTWVLFALFLSLSLGLTLLGAHDRSSSSVIQQLKLQHVNPNALSQPVTPQAPAPTGAPLSSAPPPNASFFGPAAAQAPLAAPAAQPLPGFGAPAKPRAHQRASQSKTTPPAAQPAPPVLEAPAPKPTPSQP